MSTPQKEEQSKMLPAKKENFNLMLRNKIEIEAKLKHFSNSEWIINFEFSPLHSIDLRIYQTSMRKKCLFSTLWAGFELKNVKMFDFCLRSCVRKSTVKQSPLTTTINETSIITSNVRQITLSYQNIK